MTGKELITKMDYNYHMGKGEYIVYCDFCKKELSRISENSYDGEGFFNKARALMQKHIDDNECPCLDINVDTSVLDKYIEQHNIPNEIAKEKISDFTYGVLMTMASGIRDSINELSEFIDNKEEVE